jgi:hypothetical protein
VHDSIVAPCCYRNNETLTDHKSVFTLTNFIIYEKMQNNNKFSQCNFLSRNERFTKNSVAYAQVLVFLLLVAYAHVSDSKRMAGSVDANPIFDHAMYSCYLCFFLLFCGGQRNVSLQLSREETV